MTWTMDMPDKQGYYWYHSPRMTGAVIVHVFRYGAGTPWLMNFSGDPSELELRDDLNAEWFGPLQEPPK